MLAAACLLTDVAETAAQTPPHSVADESQAVLLDNGYVLRGRLISEGEQVLIRLGPGSQVRMPRGRIQAVAGNMDELFALRARQIHRDDTAGRIDLARWCLRNDLPARAGELLVELARVEPNNPQMLALARQLRQQQSPVVPAPAAAPIEIQRADRPSDALEQISPEELARFTQHVQPILLNHCSASGCHGLASKSEFQLLRPFRGQGLTQRMTSRNLQAALQQVDRSAVLKSRLLSAASGVHGGRASTVPAGVRGEQIRQTLKDWLLAMQQEPASPVVTQLRQRRPDNLQQRVPPQAGARSNIKSSELPSPKPRNGIDDREAADPYSAEAFNRRYFPERFQDHSPLDHPPASEMPSTEKMPSESESRNAALLDNSPSSLRSAAGSDQ